MITREFNLFLNSIIITQILLRNRMYSKFFRFFTCFLLNCIIKRCKIDDIKNKGKYVLFLESICIEQLAA